MLRLPSFRALAERFPALERLGRIARRRIPYIQQMEKADCGAACLAMVLEYHGRSTRLRETREALGGAIQGVSARDLVEAGRRFGLRARGVRLETDDLELLPTGALLHWGFDHFVVLDRVSRRDVVVVDPAMGRRSIPREKVGEKFTGVALIFEPGETFERRRRRDRTLLGYLRRLLAHRRVLVRTVVLSVLMQVLALALPLLIGTIVDRVVPRQDVGLLALLAVGMAAVVGFHTLTLLLRSYLLNYLRTALDAQLSLGFIDHLVRLPFSFFITRASGDLLARFESNRSLRQSLTATTLSTLIDGSLVLSYLVLLLWVSPAMGGLVILLGVMQVGLFLALQRPVRSLAAQGLEAQAKAQSRLVELLAGMETLKASGVEQRAAERWSHLFVDELNVALDRARLGSIAGALTSALTMGSPLAILLLGAFEVLRGNLSLGTMLAVNALASGFLTPLSNLVTTAFDLQQVRSHIERIEDVLEEQPEQSTDTVRTRPRLAGGVTLREVSFRYSERSPWVVRQVSVEIAPGQKIAIVGPSGAGKSTLARLMLGLYRSESGTVLFDGLDIDGLDLQALREQIGVVTQGARIFGTTVRENIALGDPGADLDAIEQAARLAMIDDDIDRLPMGYETPLADGGASLSGGQRQRLALARALVRRPRILLLDEATSDLDAVTEARVIENLDALDCTRIVIAHRLSTIADADLILAMKGGAVLEQGRHDELLARGRFYAHLVEAQLGSAGEGR